MSQIQIILLVLVGTGLFIVLSIGLWHGVRAALGYADSQALLGDSFSRQVVLTPLGVRLLKASLVQGHVPAMYYYGYYLQIMTSRQHTALRWYRRAAKRGSAEAALALAMLAADGVLDAKGAPSRRHFAAIQSAEADELALALSWLLISVALGHKVAHLRQKQFKAVVADEVWQQAQQQAQYWLVQNNVQTALVNH